MVFFNRIFILRTTCLQLIENHISLKTALMKIMCVTLVFMYHDTNPDQNKQNKKFLARDFYFCFAIYIRLSPEDPFCKSGSFT